MSFGFRTSRVVALCVMLFTVAALAQDWQRKAAEMYPDLGVANSPLNKKYRALYQERLRTNPAFFRLPQWPVLLAKEAAAQVGAQTAAQTPAAPVAAPVPAGPSEPPAIVAGRKLLVAKCGRCHDTPNARMPEMQWNRAVAKWRTKAELTEDEFRQLLEYGSQLRATPPPSGTTPESPEMAAGKLLFQTKCCGCHDVPSPSRVEEGTWTRWMLKMRGKAKLTDAEYDQIMDYARRAREAYMLKMLR
jgi:cytochrome c5